MIKSLTFIYYENEFLRSNYLYKIASKVREESIQLFPQKSDNYIYLRISMK